MNNNIALLTSIKYDKVLLESEYNHFIDNTPNKQWDWRTFFQTQELTDFYKNLVESIETTIQVKAKNCLFQIYDPRVYKEKWYLNIVHRDDDRSSCITIPVVLNDQEPVMFYDDIPGIDFKAFKRTNRAWPEKPQQICRYNDKHPNLVNVNRLHNVRVLDMSRPRVLFQLSFDESFENIINRNPDIWQLL